LANTDLPAVLHALSLAVSLIISRCLCPTLSIRRDKKFNPFQSQEGAFFIVFILSARLFFFGKLQFRTVEERQIHQAHERITPSDFSLNFNAVILPQSCLNSPFVCKVFAKFAVVDVFNDNLTPFQKRLL